MSRLAVANERRKCRPSCLFTQTFPSYEFWVQMKAGLRSSTHADGRFVRFQSFASSHVIFSSGFWSSLTETRVNRKWTICTLGQLFYPLKLPANGLHKKKTPRNTNLVPPRLDLRRSKTPLRGSLLASSPVEVRCRGGKRGRTTSYPSFHVPPPERPGETARRLLRGNPEDEARERTNPYYIPILHEVLRFALIFKAWTVKCNVAIRIS